MAARLILVALALSLSGSTLGTFSSMSAMVPAVMRGSLADLFDNLAAIARVTAPVFLYHGTRDEVVPFAMGGALQQAGGPQVTVVPLEGGGHQVPMDRLAELVWANFAAR